MINTGLVQTNPRITGQHNTTLQNLGIETAAVFLGTSSAEDAVSKPNWDQLSMSPAEMEPKTEELQFAQWLLGSIVTHCTERHDQT